MQIIGSFALRVVHTLNVVALLCLKQVKHSRRPSVRQRERRRTWLDLVICCKITILEASQTYGSPHPMYLWEPGG